MFGSECTIGNIEHDDSFAVGAFLSEDNDSYCPEKSHSEDIFCVCKSEDDGSEMIMCEAENCSIEWFHIRCLNIRRVPKGKWVCPNCKKK